MKSTSASILSAAALALGLLASAVSTGTAAPLNLSFSTTSTAANGTGAFGAYHKGPVLLYTGVVTTSGTLIDARVTTSVWGNTSLGTGVNSGLYANYSVNTPEPNRDAALYFTADSLGLGGVHYDMEFFISGTTIPYTLSEFNLMVYDIDGDHGSSMEVRQQEELKAYTTDGLTSYRLVTGPSQLAATPIDGGMNFKGTPDNWSEVNINAAVILNYQNTSKLTLDFSANTSGGLPNGSFIAIDGDLSFANGDFSQFAPPVAVPEPGTAGLLGGAALLGLAAGRRRRA